VPILVIGALFVLFFWNFLYSQVRISIENPDWSHAFLLPIISLYFILINRHRILTLPITHNWLGLLLMLGGMAIYFAFTLSNLNNHTVQGFGMIVCLSGVVLLMVGGRMWWATLFAQWYLILGVRMPPPLLGLITPTLQRWAAVGSYYLLNIIGYQTEVFGNQLTIFHNGQNIPLNIEEACSGLRMIVGFVALGVAVAFLTCTSWWQRVVLVLLAIPVAIFINILRVATIGFMSVRDLDWAEGEAHIFLGMIWLLPAFVLYLGLVWIVQHIIVEEEE